MPTAKTFARQTLLCAFSSALLIAGLLPQTAVAHDDEHRRIGGKSLKMSYDPTNASRSKFLFKTSNQLAITEAPVVDDVATGPLAIDPRTVTSKLIVEVDGDTPDSTGIITLDPENWAPAGSSGWKYDGNTYYFGDNGVDKIKLRGGGNGGQLQIQAKGTWWPLQVLGESDNVRIYLIIGGFTYCAEYASETMTEGFKRNELGSLIAGGASAPTDCATVCGNGFVELGEQCDDGNSDDADTCTSECIGCDSSGGTEFASSFEGIQATIFDSEVYGCNNDLCHGASQSGGLDLRPGASYDELINVDSQIDPSTVRVYPGEQALSLLYEKLAAKTLGSDLAPNHGSPMPQNAATVSVDHLEALRLWIRGGAPESTVVEGTAALLGTCLPPADPAKIPQPDPPAVDEGFQVAMPGYELLSQTERELCVASFYDLTSVVPAEAMIDCPGAFPGTNDDHGGPNEGKCVAYAGDDLFQDPQSHHSIVRIYTGEYDYDDAGWGTWTCYLGDNDGEVCDPTNPAACPGGVCGGNDHEGVACLGGNPSFGPPDFSQFGNTAPMWSGSQESTAQFNYPDGVYAVLPLRGIIVWNSHSFNLTNEDMRMESWINVFYATDQEYLAQGLFNDNWIFTQDVPPYEEREYCATHTFQEGTRLFQLSSHTHKRGKRWRYFLPPQTPCSGGGNNQYGYPQTNSGCVPSGTEFYESFNYSDPLTLDFDPPMHFTGTQANRTIKFCGTFRNGVDELGNEIPTEVKRQSTSPDTGNPFIPGGPCDDDQVKCLGGPNKGDLCHGNDSECPDSVCDACNAWGGVRTEDEMFIAIGTYYVAP